MQLDLTLQLGRDTGAAKPQKEGDTPARAEPPGGGPL